MSLFLSINKKYNEEISKYIKGDVAVGLGSVTDNFLKNNVFLNQIISFLNMLLIVNSFLNKSILLNIIIISFSSRRVISLLYHIAIDIKNISFLLI